MKKKVLILFLILLLAAGAAAAVWYFKFRDEGGTADAENAVFVDSVASITGVGGNGLVTRFTGVVEPQKTVGVEVASGLKVKDTYVTVGQEVDVGTPLFSYDTDEAQDSITQLEIDIENYDIDIESTQAQIAQYEKERAQVSDSEKRAYTTSIMTAENSIRRAEYNKKSKQAELESLKKQVANAEVTCELKGVVKSINKSNSGSDDTAGMDMGYTGSGSTDENASAYIVIMSTGAYRIKGLINEMNYYDIQEGMDVLIRSRVDETVTWKGVVSTIDMENAVQNQNMYYSSSDSSSSSSSYPFYVDMEDSTGLMLGQHVYVEPDYGQDEVRDGMWLDYYYLIGDEDGAVTPYVWAADEKDKLERRHVLLGDYDNDREQYEILDGLTEDDYIAFPDETLQEGMPVTRNAQAQIGGDSLPGIDDMGDMGDLGDLGMMEDMGDMGDLGTMEDLGDLGMTDDMGGLGDLGVTDDMGSLGDIGTMGDMGAMEDQGSADDVQMIDGMDPGGAIIEDAGGDEFIGEVVG